MPRYTRSSNPYDQQPYPVLPYVAGPQPVPSGQVPVPQTPIILPVQERRRQYQQDLRERRTQSSPNFLESVRRNNAEKAARQQYQADRRAPVPQVPAGVPPTPMAPPVVPAGQNVSQPGFQGPLIPSAAPTPSAQPATAPAMHKGRNGTMRPDQLPGAFSSLDHEMPLKSADPTKARATITLGSPASPGTPGETRGAYAGRVVQSERNQQVLRNRGLGGDIVPQRPAPIPSTPATGDTRTRFTVDYDRPVIPALSPAAQQQQQAAEGNYYSNVANIRTGGIFADEARQDLVASTQAESARLQGEATQAKVRQGDVTAQAAADAAKAKVIEAQRPRQATPGTKPATDPDEKEIQLYLPKTDSGNEHMRDFAQRHVAAAQGRLNEKRAAATQPTVPYGAAGPTPQPTQIIPPAPADSAAGEGTELTPDVAAQIFQEAGGDPVKATAIARSRGYRV